MQVSAENFKKQLEVTSKIDLLLSNIHQDTGGMSTHIHILRHNDFAELCSMGERIIPYLFHVILHNGFSWIIIHLLCQITKQQPVSKEHVGKAWFVLIDWAKWFTESKYYKSDVYYGLVDAKK